MGDATQEPETHELEPDTFERLGVVTARMLAELTPPKDRASLQASPVSCTREDAQGGLRTPWGTANYKTDASFRTGRRRG